MATGEQVAAAAAAHIEARMLETGMQRESLSRETGIARETLSRKLHRTPRLFTVDELVRISEALQMPVEDLFLGVPA